MKNDSVCGLIKKRRSTRCFLNGNINSDKIQIILTAGTLAPSGKNGQPWKFAIIHKNKELLKQISALTAHNGFVSRADCLITVYLDKSQSYDYIKDVQAIGGCIENMLLQAAELGIGSCWIGEILNKAAEVNVLLSIDSNLELMAIIALGYPDEKRPQPI